MKNISELLYESDEDELDEQRKYLRDSARDALKMKAG